MNTAAPTEREIKLSFKSVDEAREAVGHLLSPQPTAPPRARLVIPAIAALSVATLPRWARRLYGLPGLPTTDLAATGALKAIRKKIRAELPTARTEHGGASLRGAVRPAK